ncbi:leucine-rich PPR motif-containing protein, mitochondrial-like [Sitodiplosis mosellana]|uniref:leucine-rich PPR motif-containing protein, mitochondrial-like n=1 Tax=Sitodiplosis mosellana TaxID=263140 RepID=UPI002443F1A3|nr:leucine-rich PPR motif-containing protein, mitochondrial-like [Sitodiplosis mosellana]
MFRLILAQAKKPIDLSAFTLTFCAKATIGRPIREISDVKISRTLNTDSCVFQCGTKQFLVNTNQSLSINSSFCHNYATDVTNGKIDKLKSLSDFIAELNDRVRNNNRISQYELKILHNKIETQKVTNEQALVILRFCSFGRLDQNLSETVKSIWYELEKHGHELGTQHYNYLLQFASDKQDVNLTQSIFDELISDGIEPDATSYHCLLSVYCKCGNIRMANEILDMMDQNQLSIDERSFNNVIQCHIICGNIEAANETIATLNKNGFKINRDTLTTLLSHYAKAGDLENIRKTIATFETENIELLNYDILNVICESVASGHADKIDTLFEYLKPNAELRTSLPNAITLFVTNKQSIILPKILQFVDKAGEAGDIKSLYKHLINDMVRYDTSEEEFTATIKLIEATGFTVKNSFEMFKPALKSSSEVMIRQLLAHMKTNGIEVTDVAFEKLFQLSAGKGVDAVLEVMNLMCTDFKIYPHIAYIRDVILPALNADDDMALALTKLKQTRIPVHRTVKACVNSSLNKYDFKTAINLLKNYECFYANRFITETLLNAYATTGDVRNFVRIVKIIYDNFSKINEYYREATLSDADVRKRQMTFVGEMLYSSIAHTLTDAKRLAQLMHAFIAEGLTTSPNQIQKIQQHLLKVDDQLQIGRLLTQLSAHKMQLKPINAKQRGDMGQQQSSIELQSMLDEQRSLGRNVAGTEKLLFLAHIREGNVSEVESMMKSSSTLNITNANYGMLIDLYGRIGNLEKGLNVLKQACAKDPSFKLYPMTTARLVTLMYENKFSFDEMEALLYTQRQDKVILNNNVPFEQLLQRMAADGHTQMIEQLFSALIKFNYIKATVDTTGPLITVHLKIASYDKAVEKYEYLAKTYKFMPMSVVLFKELIQKNQKDLLGRAFNTHKSVHGESDAVSRLAFAYSECGQVDEAKLLFASNRIHDITKEVGKVCRVYTTSDDIESARILLKSTAGVACDRRIIYQTVLDIYYKHSMAEKALELWTEISNDNILPTPNFIDKLAELLKANNIELPSDLETKITANFKIQSKNR